MFGLASSYQLSKMFTGDVVLEEDTRGHRGGYKFQIAYNCVKKSIIVVFVDGYLDDDLTHRNATNPLLRYDPEIVGKYRIVCEPNYYSFATRRLGSLQINRKFTQRSSV